MTRLELFTAHAMLCVISETQESVPDGVWNWVKELLRDYVHMRFLVVKYRTIENAYQDAAKRAVEYAEACCRELKEKGYE